jgi:hypothetical protein
MRWATVVLTAAMLVCSLATAGNRSQWAERDAMSPETACEQEPAERYERCVRELRAKIDKAAQASGNDILGVVITLCIFGVPLVLVAWGKVQEWAELRRTDKS